MKSEIKANEPVISRSISLSPKFNYGLNQGDLQHPFEKLFTVPVVACYQCSINEQEINSTLVVPRLFKLQKGGRTQVGDGDVHVSSCKFPNIHGAQKPLPWPLTCISRSSGGCWDVLGDHPYGSLFSFLPVPSSSPMSPFQRTET